MPNGTNGTHGNNCFNSLTNGSNGTNAINGRDLHVFLDIGWDDEHDVSVTVPKRYGRGAEIYMGFIVAHLGFAPQRKTGLEEDKLRKRYKKIGSIL